MAAVLFRVYLLLLFPICLSGCQSCGQEDTKPEPFPGYTQNGANRVGCYVNGQEWYTNKPSQNMLAPGKRDPVIVYGGEGSNEFSFSANWYLNPKDATTSEMIVIGTSDFAGLGAYGFRPGGTAKLNFYRLNELCSMYHRDSSTFREGDFTVTFLDHQKRIVAGTFWANLWKQGCDTVRITGGRFDLRY